MKRFSAYGEDWVARKCWQSPTRFPLHDAPAEGKPVAESNDLRVYLARDFAALHIERFVYFALSTFWRGAVRRWSATPGDVVDIGEHEPALRRFLLGEEGLPKDIALSMMVSWDKTDIANKTMTLPWFAGGYPVRKIKFDIPGVSFTLLLGPNLPGEIVRTCAAHTGLVTVCATADKWRREIARGMVTKAAVKGKLRYHPRWRR